MKKSDIAVGKTYRNKGAGRTTRRVIAIGPGFRPRHFFSRNSPPIEDGVLYLDDKGAERRLYISSFASWSGSVVTEGHITAAPGGTQ